jgi:hypothetical protein
LRLHALHSIIHIPTCPCQSPEPPHGVSKGIYLLKGKEAIATRHLNNPNAIGEENRIFVKQMNAAPPTM